MDLKTKFGVTIFSNGDMNIVKESLQEDLWRDYQFFCKKADSHRHKQSPKANLLVCRYERTAVITLFTFFSAVLDSWRIRQGTAGSVVSLTAACQAFWKTAGSGVGSRLISAIYWPFLGGTTRTGRLCWKLSQRKAAVI